MKAKQMYLAMVLELLDEEGREWITQLTGTSAFKTVVTMENPFLGAGPATVDPALGTAFFDAQTMLLNDLQALVGMMLDRIEMQSEGIVAASINTQVVNITALLLCIGLSLALAVSVARSIAVPFMHMYTTAEGVSKESKELVTHCEVTGRFVPYETLALMGVTNITELAVGQSVIRRLTIMCGDIVGFTSLSSRLPSEDVFKCVHACAGFSVCRDNGFIGGIGGVSVAALRVMPGRKWQLRKAAALTYAGQPENCSAGGGGGGGDMDARGRRGGGWRNGVPCRALCFV